MRLRERRNHDEIEVNLTPLIDVVFLLLIFFVLTTTFEKEARLHIELPKASSGEQSPLQKPAEIIIDADGTIELLGSAELGSPEVDWYSALKARAATQQDLAIVVRADRQTPHGAVVTVMDGARQLNLLNLSIITERTH
ncbi:MAG: biopolymer transporter ExbD [Gammaproteobacteria bacterium]|jgi:biopolymer transport protein ExbD|nr:biopolymer transporter ExbD [Gammaproteobacteria bacterium]MBT4605535.1 biopolymer transporter ExbD [Thiotrichales bacterium]MBT3473228.1 biopolymer transporter ExbD [Gammaproteobacteria bacterium]MBT3967352.1 biopolymer transporter ExbD [Gammaproteobacteria bacterium]MBT4081801.1 biopolymer transporter ExbD [Gammaproteobacteria bacterium]